MNRLMGSELKQETYFIEGKGWRTHHVISNTSSIELEATPEEIDAVKLKEEPKHEEEPAHAPKPAANKKHGKKAK